MAELKKNWNSANSVAITGVLILILTQADFVTSQFLTGDDGQPIDITLGRPNGPHLDIHSEGGQTEIDLDLGGIPRLPEIDLDLGGRPRLPEIDIDFGRPRGEIDLSGLFGSGSSSGSSSSSSGSESSSSTSESESSGSGSESESSSSSSESESSSSSESESSDSSSTSETEVTVSETSETTSETESSSSTSEAENSDSSSSSTSGSDSSDTSSTTTSETSSSSSSSSSSSATGSGKTSQGGSSKRGSGKKKMIKKGKRKVKKRRMWQSSFSQQSVRAGGVKQGTNSTGGGKKVKVVKRRLGWEQNMFSSNRPGNVKQTAARRELLQKRWNTAGERATEPVGLKDVGVMSSRTASQPNRATAKPIGKTATVVKKRKTQNRAASTRFQSSAKSALATTRQQAKAETTKLKLALKNPLSGKSTKRLASASSRNRAATPTRKPTSPVSRG